MPFDFIITIIQDKAGGGQNNIYGITDGKWEHDSVDITAAKQQRNLLENLPSEEWDRYRLDDHRALKEDLKKIWESFT